MYTALQALFVCVYNLFTTHTTLLVVIQLYARVRARICAARALALAYINMKKRRTAYNAEWMHKPYTSYTDIKINHILIRYISNHKY